MQMQVTLAAIAQNLKRLVKYLNQPLKSAPNRAVVCPERPLFSLFYFYQPLLRLESPWFHRLLNSFSTHHHNPALQMT